MAKEDMWGKLGRIDPRILYVLLVIILIIPLIAPIGLPIPITSETRKIYDAVEKLPPGSVVVCAMDTSGAAWGENGPQAKAILRHLFQKPLKIVVVSFEADGPMLGQRALLEVPKGEKKYGVDYVNLGFVAGGETGRAAFGRDVQKLISKDFLGNPLEKLPIMEKVRNAEDFALFFTFTSLISAVEMYVRQLYAPYKTKVVAGIIGLGVPAVVPYYNAGQLFSILSGSLGAGEYELLSKMPGEGVRLSDALSLSTLLVVVLIVVGNAAFFGDKLRGKEEKR